MKKKCLLLETKDKRKFFTYPKHYKELAEFSKNFGAVLSIVQIDNPILLSLNELAPILCTPDVQYCAEFKVEKPVAIRENKSEKIKEYIKQKFLNKEVVELQTVAKKFKKNNLTLACFCQHISKIRKTLTDEGYKIIKVGGGKYKLI